MDAPAYSGDAEGHALEHDHTDGLRPGGLVGWRWGPCEEEPEVHSFFLSLSSERKCTGSRRCVVPHVRGKQATEGQQVGLRLGSTMS